jgi:hypothetical protein
MTFIDPSHLDLEDRVVTINRVTKVLKVAVAYVSLQLLLLVIKLVTLALVLVKLKKFLKQFGKLLKMPRKP